MLTTNSPFVDNTIMESELRASLVYHPFKAQIPDSAISNLASVISLSRYGAQPFEAVLNYVTQILLAYKEISAAHTNDEIAAIAYGMVQRANESSAFAPADASVEPAELIY